MREFLTPLPDRGFIRATGSEWRSFLQGVLTKDIETLEPGDLGYGYLLNARSKIIADLFLYVAVDNQSVILSCAAQVLPRVLKLLTLYKLRAEVLLEQASHSEVVSSKPLDYQGGGDPRSEHIGYRYLAPGLGSIEENYSDYMSWAEARLRAGVLEGSEYGEEALFPMECNGEYINALSFDKGCYIGQELVTRTKRVGEIRKLVFPGVLETNSAEVSPGETLYFDGEKVGKVLFSTSKLCMLLLQYKRLPIKQKPLVSTEDGVDIRIQFPEVLHALID